MIKLLSTTGLDEFQWKVFYFGFILKVLAFVKWKIGCIKGSLLGLRQFLAARSPLKMMKTVFYFMLKALFIH